MEKRVDEKKVKLILLILFVVVALIGLLINIFNKTGEVVEVLDYPKGIITSEPTRAPEGEAPDYLTEYLAADSVSGILAVPEGFERKDDYIRGTMGYTDFIIMGSGESLESLMKNELPSRVNKPLLGYEPTYTHISASTGYFYETPAEYRVAVVDTKISVREVKEYTVAYSFPMLKGKNLVFYASAESVESLIEAEKILRDFARYSSGEIVDDGRGDAEEEDELFESGIVPEDLTYIREEVENVDYLEDGVCILEWSNVYIEPDIYLDKNDGTGVLPMEEYSLPGHYVFYVGKIEPGIYVFRGSMYAPSLSDVRVTFVELESYESLLYSEDYINIPDFDE